MDVVLPEIRPELMARELVRLYAEPGSSGIPSSQRPLCLPHEPNPGITLAFRPRISSFAGRIMRTLWLADHLLVSERGHHVSYNGFIADSARRAGLDVRILCARECDVEVPGGFRMLRIFRKDWRNNPPPLLSRSRLALDILEILAKRRFRVRLGSRGSCQRTSGAMTSSLRKCWRREILLGWLGWLESFPQTARADPGASSRLCGGALWSEFRNSPAAQLAEAITANLRARDL